MIYLTLGQGVRQGITLYQGIHDNKPPLLYLAAAVAGNLFWFKAILAFWMLCTIVLFYKLAKTIFSTPTSNNHSAHSRTVMISTILFATLTTLPLLEGNTVNAELFMIGPSILAFLILLSKKLTFKIIFLAGVLFSIAALFKIPALFDFPIIIIYWLITNPKEWRQIIKNSLVLAAGFSVPIVLTFIWYGLKGAFTEYFTAAFLQNVGYLSSFRPSDVQKPFYIRNAPLLIRAFIVLAGTSVVFFFRKKISSRFILLSIWTLFALFAITLSERPYPHYFIQILAPLSLFLGIFFSERTFEQVITVIPLAITLFVPVYYKFWLYPTTTYYTRFIEFATSKITKDQYFSSFSANTVRNYKLAEFIALSTTQKDRVFMWDEDSAAVYALSRRFPPTKYVVPYHVNDYSNRTDVANTIFLDPPKFIILTSGNSYPEISTLISKRYVLITQVGNANVYSRIDLAPAR